MAYEAEQLNEVEEIIPRWQRGEWCGVAINGRFVKRPLNRHYTGKKSCIYCEEHAQVVYQAKSRYDTFGPLCVDCFWELT